MGSQLTALRRILGRGNQQSGTVVAVSEATVSVATQSGVRHIRNNGTKYKAGQSIAVSGGGVVAARSRTEDGVPVFIV